MTTMSFFSSKQSSTRISFYSNKFLGNTPTHSFSKKHLRWQPPQSNKKKISPTSPLINNNTLSFRLVKFPANKMKLVFNWSFQTWLWKKNHLFLFGLFKSEDAPFWCNLLLALLTVDCFERVVFTTHLQRGRITKQKSIF